MSMKLKDTGRKCKREDGMLCSYSGLGDTCRKPDEIKCSALGDKVENESSRSIRSRIEETKPSIAQEADLPAHYKFFGAEASKYIKAMAKVYREENPDATDWQVHCFMNACKYRLRVGKKGEDDKSLRSDVGKALNYEGNLHEQV